MSQQLAERRSANAVGGKTARACDSCLRRRARWYCAADDAFLCQGCDSSVHSANPLARRHERVRLKTSSSLPSPLALDVAPAAPSWHRGFKRKARTPRPHNHHVKPGSVAAAGPTAAAAKTEPLVPDLEANSSDETAEEEEEEQLLYRVPIFDPVLAEFSSSPQFADNTTTTAAAEEEVKPSLMGQQQLLQHDFSSSSSAAVTPVDTLPGGFLPSDVDLADFAADVESLLGRGLDDDEAFCMVGLGLTMDSRDEDNTIDCCLGDGGSRVKTEVADDSGDMMCHLDGETLELNFDCGSPATGDEEEKVAVTPGMGGEVAAAGVGLGKRKRITLRLDYEAVIDAWSSTQGCSSPWTTGERPQFNPADDDAWPDYMGLWVEAPGMVYGGVGELGVGGGGGGHGTVAAGDGGREARVSRYREKRRTRLFSKKIRYEVRKLNAEKRPRMKGRFVKRASFASSVAATSAVALGVAAAPSPAFAF